MTPSPTAVLARLLREAHARCCHCMPVVDDDGDLAFTSRDDRCENFVDQLVALHALRATPHTSVLDPGTVAMARSEQMERGLRTIQRKFVGNFEPNAQFAYQVATKALETRVVSLQAPTPADHGSRPARLRDDDVVRTAVGQGLLEYRATETPVTVFSECINRVLDAIEARIATKGP